MREHIRGELTKLFKEQGDVMERETIGAVITEDLCDHDYRHDSYPRATCGAHASRELTPRSILWLEESNEHPPDSCALCGGVLGDLQSTGRASQSVMRGYPGSSWDND